MTISDDWTPTERIRVATILLTEIQKDIYADRYGLTGRPNITIVRMVLGADALQLNQIRDSIEDFLTP
jgi:hypothetical protein